MSVHATTGPLATVFGGAYSYRRYRGAELNSSDDDASKTASLSRRSFLRWTGAAVAVSAGGPAIAVLVSSASADKAFAAPALLSAGFPRVFVFRQSEVLAQQRDYASWAAAFSAFGGIEGKLLPEERADTVSSRNIEYFAQFKRDFPNKFALMHFDGAGRLPEFETSDWWAGAWLYRAGTTLVQAVSATDTQIHVATTASFDLVGDNFGGLWSDLVVAATGATGSPDLRTAEQVRLTSIDSAAGILTVQRGCYGTTPLEFPAGSYVAEHVADASVANGANKKWLYNFATTAPTDPAGRSVIDLIVNGLAPRFAGHGSLASVDGIELDVFFLPIRQRSGCDADLDGHGDDARRDGQDVYELGLCAFASRLRTMLGPSRHLLTDGAQQQRPPPSVTNGVEEEGFPDLNDDRFTQWSGALNTLDYWSRRGRSPRMTYPMFKRRDWVPDRSRFAEFRLTLAASLFTGSLFTFYNEPRPGSCDGLAAGPKSGQFPNQFTVWDELVAGQSNTVGWLGQPAAPTVHLAERARDLFSGKGASLTADFLARIKAPGFTVTRSADVLHGYLTFQANAPQPTATITVAGIVVNGPDLVLALDLAADPPVGYGNDEPRIARVTAKAAPPVPVVGQSALVGAALTRNYFYFRDVGPATVDITFSFDGSQPIRWRNVRAFAASDACFRLFEHGAVLANPATSPHDFDLGSLASGLSLRRLMGHDDQDPVTNDGSVLGAGVTVPALDALIVQAR